MWIKNVFDILCNKDKKKKKRIRNKNDVPYDFSAASSENTY